jgi:hypothetical protein
VRKEYSRTLRQTRCDFWFYQMLHIRGYQLLRKPPVPNPVLRVVNQTDVFETEGHLLNLLDRPPLLSSPCYVCMDRSRREKESHAPINVMLCKM